MNFVSAFSCICFTPFKHMAGSGRANGSASIDRAMERDPAVAGAEWLAQFRTDVERLFTREAVVACVATGVIERAPVPSIRYHAFVDPSGGTNDAMTLAIGHRQDDIAVLDAIRERKPPFSPEPWLRNLLRY
jgi:hypothetical protein